MRHQRSPTFWNSIVFKTFLMWTYLKKNKCYHHHNIILRSEEEVGRGTILFVFCVLYCGGEERKGIYSQSAALWAIPKAVWQTCIISVRITHWICTFILRMSCGEMRVSNESDAIMLEWTGVPHRLPQTSVVYFYDGLQILKHYSRKHDSFK